MTAWPAELDRMERAQSGDSAFGSLEWAKQIVNEANAVAALGIAVEALRNICGWTHAEEWHPADDAKLALKKIDALAPEAKP